MHLKSKRQKNTTHQIRCVVNNNEEIEIKIKFMLTYN